MIPDTRLVGNIALLPVKTQFKGPARGDGEIILLMVFSQATKLKLVFVHIVELLWHVSVPFTQLSFTSLYGPKSAY